MPVILNESEAANDHEAVALINETTGEPTQAAVLINEFLTHADFTPVLALEGLDDLTLDAQLDEDDGDDVGALPGFLAAALLDEGDLADSFEHFCYDRFCAGIEEGASLTQVAEARAIADLFGIDLEEAKKQKVKPPYKKGTFKRLSKMGGAMRTRAVRSMLAMLNKGVIKRTKKGGYAKDKGYRKGGTPAGKAKVAKYKGANAAKVKKASKKALAASTEPNFDFDDLSECPIFGVGEPIGGASYVVDVHEDAEERLSEMKGKHKGKKGKDFYKAMMAKKGKGGDEDHDDDADESANESQAPATDAQRTSRLAEGARLAGKVAGVMESRNAPQAAESLTETA